MKKLISNPIRKMAEMVEEFVMDNAHVPSESVEHLSSLIHDQWISWARNLALHENLSGERLDRWNKLYVPYDQLSEDMKAEDRKFALKFLNSISEGMVKDVFRGYLASVPEDWNYIFPEKLHDMFKSGEINSYMLIDLRKPEDFAEGHIPGAINIFWLDFMRVLSSCNMENLPKDKRIIIYCYLGHTSSQILPLLKILGYDAKSLKFGIGRPPVQGVQIKGWMDYNFKIEKE